MSENKDLGHLKFLFTDDLYIIDDPVKNYDPQTETEAPQVAELQPDEPVQKVPAAPLLDRSLFLIQNNNLDAELEALLYKIIGAVKLTDDQYDIDFTDDTEIIPINNDHKVQIIFLASDNPMPMARYESMQIDGRTIVYSDMLDEIASDVNKKKRLWNALQELFL